MRRRHLACVLAAVSLLLAVGVGTAAAASPGVQTVSQSADNAQQATSASGATQIAPSNSNIDVRVLSPGDDGAVTQSNTASSDASSSNSNSTTQGASQDPTGTGIQTADQSANSGQASTALSGALQAGASNSNLPVNVLSPGNDGAVTQSNGDTSSATSANTNTTTQAANQNQSGGSSCGCETTLPETASPDSTSGQGQSGGGSTPSVQSVDQSAQNGQIAGSASSATQIAPSNSNISVRVLSPGNDGPVTQSNTDTSNASATNANSTTQKADQDQGGGSSSCGCGSAGDIQTAQQSAGNLQIAGAASNATQIGAKNVNTPVRVLSPGNDGPVSQSNSVSSTATSTNSNDTTQSVHQNQGGGCGCEASDPIQVADQSSGSLQDAGAFSAAGQIDPVNSNSPVRVGSSGDGGSVSQSNTADSTATSSNTNSTKQKADQDQSSGDSPCGCGGGTDIQALGQEADNGQVALSASGTLQEFGGQSECGCGSSGSGNSNGPVRVWSPGSDGSVTQSNTADSTADSSNSNSTSQHASQNQSGGAGIAIQALGQQADNGQFAGALSGTFQLDPSNSAKGVRVYSPGGGGSLDQSNDASSTANATNTNTTKQKASQDQDFSGLCTCDSGPQIQALGQSAANLQGGFAFSTAFQLAPSNAGGGLDVWSPGKGSTTTQGNDATSTGGVDNGNAARQFARQDQ